MLQFWHSGPTQLTHQADALPIELSRLDKVDIDIIRINVTELLMNGATSIPKSVLHFVLDKVLNSNLEFNFFPLKDVPK